MEIRGTKSEPIVPQESSQSGKELQRVEQKQVGFSGQDQIDPAISNLFSELADGGAGVSPQKDTTGDGLIAGQKPEGSEEQTPLSVFDQNVELMNLFAAPFDTPAGTDEGNFFQHDLPSEAGLTVSRDAGRGSASKRDLISEGDDDAEVEVAPPDDGGGETDAAGGGGTGATGGAEPSGETHVHDAGGSDLGTPDELKKQSDADNSGGAAFGEMSDEEKAAYVKNNEDSRNAFVKSQEEAQKLSDDMHREMGTSPISPDESKKIFDQQEKEILGGGEKPTNVTVGVDFVPGSNPGIATPNWDTVYTQETPPSPAAEEAKLKSQVSQPVDDTSRSFGKMEIDSRVLIQSTLERHTDGKSTPIPDGIDTPTGPGGSGVPTNPGDPDPVDVDSPGKE